jgi:hypothetical protein
VSFGYRRAGSPFEHADESEDKGVDSDREERTCHDQVEPPDWQQAQGNPYAGEDEREFPDLRHACRDR